MNSQDWDARYREKELVWSKGPNQFLVQEVEGMQPCRAIDIACGEGRNALWLAEQGYTVRATDFSPVGIAKGKARAAELGLDIDWAVEDAATPQTDEFDLVLLFYIHVPADKLAAVMAAATACLAPGGTLLLVGHDKRNIDEGVGGPQEPSILYGPDELRPLVEGLTIERCETIPRAVAVEGGTVDALDVILRAKRERS